MMLSLFAKPPPVDGGGFFWEPDYTFILDSPTSPLPLLQY